MLFKTHFSFSILIFLLLFSTQQNWWIFLAGILISTALVDIDSKQSKIGKYKIFRPLQLFLKHRGIMHTLLAAIILTLLSTMINIQFAFAFFIGYMGHLTLDILTRQGIKLFYPFSNKKIRIGVKTNGYTEIIIFSVLTTINLIIILLTIYNLM